MHLEKDEFARRYGHSEHLDRLTLSLSPADSMFVGNHWHYLRVGANALQLLETAISLSNRTRPISRILDYACGHGRVLRWIQAAFPEADVVAADADVTGARAVGEMFGVEAHEIHPPAFPAFGGSFSLIWVGSLITHLPEQATRDVVNHLAGLLEPEGLLVITMCGAEMEREIRTKKRTLGFGDGEEEALLTGLETDGYGFGNYRGEEAYGIAISRPSKFLSILEDAGLRPVMYQESAWDGRQDVGAAIRPAPRLQASNGA